MTKTFEAIDKLKEVELELHRLKNALEMANKALAQQEQEPVALEEKFSLLLWDYQELERAFEKVTGGKWVRKSNTPQRTWVGLTKDEVEILAYKAEGNTWKAVELAEAKLKEKNT